MKEQGQMFYEDMRKIKKRAWVFTIIFYAGAVSALLSVLFFFIFLPEHAKYTIEEAIHMCSVWLFAIFLNVITVKSKYLNSYLAITENEIKFFMKDTLYNYDTADLITYRINIKSLWYIKCKLFLTDGRDVIIGSRKIQKLIPVLDRLIAKNIEQAKKLKTNNTE